RYAMRDGENRVDAPEYVDDFVHAVTLRARGLALERPSWSRIPFARQYDSTKNSTIFVRLRWLCAAAASSIRFIRGVTRKLKPTVFSSSIRTPYVCIAL